ncbi:MAG: histidine kinase dimerization/phosphoacceptor domain -containing protein [Spirochaetota bacterium]
MKAAVSRLQRNVGLGGFVTCAMLIVLGYPIYVSVDPERSLLTFVTEPLALQLMLLAAVFIASARIPHPLSRLGQVSVIVAFGLVVLSGADVDSLTGLLIIGVGVILAAQYGHFRTYSRLKVAWVTLVVVLALAIQAGQHWLSAGLSETILAFLYNATAVMGLIAAYVIVWQDATSQIASRQAELESAVERRTTELSRENQARLAAEQASLEAAEKAERLAAERLALLREVHHRAKNSLQMTLTLLDGMDVLSPESRDTTIDQVRAIGLVYDLVDASENLSAISLEDYLENLIAHLRMAENGTQTQIWFQAEARIRSRLDPTVNLGLMIVEIMRLTRLSTIEPGLAIMVSERLSDTSVQIEISYGGRPVPATIDPDADDVSTTGLLTAFIRRLHVDLTIERGQPNRWSLSIPREVLTFAESQ